MGTVVPLLVCLTDLVMLSYDLQPLCRSVQYDMRVMEVYGGDPKELLLLLLLFYHTHCNTTVAVSLLEVS